MNPTVLEIAASIIRSSSRERPADAVLRSQLKEQAGLSRTDSTEVTRMVFAFFRWFGWLDKNLPIIQQIERASELAKQFARQPESISDAELTTRAIPDWARDQVNITPEWARALQGEPVLWLRARPHEGKAVASKVGDCRPFGAGPLGDILKYNGREDLFRHPVFQEGAFELQDISSQAVGLVCAPQPGQTWWDACAGEGGKLLHLSALMENKGLIWATDRAAWRLDKLKRRTARARSFNYRSRVWDGGQNLPTKTRFDGVLVDAPCSGIGTWQRNPHARWTVTPEDVSELAAVQKRLLQHVAPAVKPGGKLIYAVCSLARAETVEVARAFLAELPSFESVLLVNPLAPEVPAADQLWLWPQHFGGNGMFVAAWVRKE
jgi:16S rRNA (cytosine967-C5)-methyltransferase